MLLSVGMAIRQHLQRHILTIGLLIIVVGLIAASETLHDKTEAIILWTEGMISQAPLVGMLIFVLLAMLSAMVAFFSSALLAPVAIYAWGKAGCLALLWSGWFLGGIVSYGIGRFFGRAGVAMLIGEEKIAGWENQVSQRTRFLHILIFQAVVPSEIPGYLLGILRYRFLFYLAALGITEIPYAVATIYLGESFLQGNSVVFLLVGVGMLVLATIVVQIHRRMIQTGEDSDLA
ncbi:MAG: TVP38/TMEM64 family protein [Woeseiaceae bacterium]